MNSNLSCALIVLLLFVKKTLSEFDAREQKVIDEFCIEIGKLKKFVDNQWTGLKYIERRSLNKPSQSANKPTNRAINSSTKKSSTLKPEKSTSSSNSSIAYNQENITNYTLRSKIIDGRLVLEPAFLTYSVRYFVGVHFRKDYESMPLCGGVLIDRFWILTSESCITRNMFSPFTPNRFIQMPLVVVNTDYKSKMRNKPSSEIELICRLTDERNEWVDVVLARIKPKIYLKLYPKVGSNSIDIHTLVTVGVGATSQSDEKDEPHQNFTKHWILIAESERCSELITKRGHLVNSFCAKGDGPFTDPNRKAKGHSCTNDAGGPVLGYEPKTMFPDRIKGIISNLDYERPCMTNHHWRMYSRTDVVSDKISKIMNSFRN